MISVRPMGDELEAPAGHSRFARHAPARARSVLHGLAERREVGLRYGGPFMGFRLLLVQDPRKREGADLAPPTDLSLPSRWAAYEPNRP